MQSSDPYSFESRAGNEVRKDALPPFPYTSDSVIMPGGATIDSGLNSFRKPLKVAVNTQGSLNGQDSLIYRQPYNQSSTDDTYSQRPSSTLIHNYQVVPEEEMITFPTGSTTYPIDDYLNNRF